VTQRVTSQTLAVQPRIDLHLARVYARGARATERVERFHRERSAIVERLVERLRLRTTRIEGVVRHPSAAPVPVAVRPTSRELAVLLPRLAPSATVPARAPAVLLRAAGRGRPSEGRPSPEPAAVALAGPLVPIRHETTTPAPVLDVAGLTDQVIDAIDRRIVVERERHGRL
jgi:hypothetical protein